MAQTLDIAKIEAEIGKLMAETVKLNAEAAKLQRESKFYPFIAVAAFITGIVAVARLFMA